MGDEWQQNPGYSPQNQRDPQNTPEPDSQKPLNGEVQEPSSAQDSSASQPFNQENIDKRIEDIKRMVIQGAGEAHLDPRRFLNEHNVGSIFTPLSEEGSVGQRGLPTLWHQKVNLGSEPLLIVRTPARPWYDHGSARRGAG